jgi:acetylornithine aminotransferase
MQTYGRLPVSFVRGEGVWLWDDKGRKYLDAFSGVAVCGLGHAHPNVTKAICDQAKKLLHTSNWYHIESQETLAKMLCKMSGMDKVFFSNSGAEANETAIKLARLYGHGRRIQSPKIIVTEGSFHGRTLATLTATGNRKVQAGFEPLVQGFIRAPYNNVEAIDQVGSSNQDIVAILVEPITGEGGIVIPKDGYLQALRRICDERGWLLILDEIQTGMGRTGRWFAFQHEGISPDVLTLAKSLGNGIPIGACLARADAALVLQTGNHGSTFGGNPLACHAGSAVIQTLMEANLDRRAAQLGKYILTGLQKGLSELTAIKNIRGKGLMIAVELDRPCKELMITALERGLLINVTAESVVRLLPPLIMTDGEADQVIEVLTQIIHNFVGTT